MEILKPNGIRLYISNEVYQEEAYFTLEDHRDIVMIDLTERDAKEIIEHLKKLFNGI